MVATSDIQIWVDHLPSEARLANSERDSRKRSATSQKHNRPLNKRRAITLEEVEINIMPELPSRQAQKRTATQHQRHTPSRQSRRGRSGRADTAQYDRPAESCDIEPDTDKTPRPLQNAPSWDPDHSQRGSSNASRSSNSPTRMAHLESISGGLQYSLVGSVDNIHGDHDLYPIQHLLLDLDNFREGHGIIPIAMQTSTAHYSLRHKSCYDSTPQRTNGGGTPSLAAVQELSHASADAKEIQDADAGWNCWVHAPILAMAVKEIPLGDKLRVANITRAKIEPAILIPQRDRGLTIPSKTVDFAVDLRRSSAIKASLENLEYKPGVKIASLNHTIFNTVLAEPIAFSIEMKTLTANTSDALIQLTIWSGAQFNRLEQLFNEAGTSDTLTKLPVLPLLSIMVIPGSCLRPQEIETALQ